MRFELILLGLIYLLIIVPLIYTYVKQIKLVYKTHKNGFQNYRRALSIIVFSNLIDAIFVGALTTLWISNTVAITSIVGLYILIAVKSITAGGAWLWFFIYRGSKFRFMKFITVQYWQDLLGKNSKRK